MKVHEYQAKALLQEYGIPVPREKVASTPDEARAIASEIGRPVVVKAQVLVGGRGKAGGVKTAGDPDEAAARASEILGMSIKGVTVREVLVAEALDIRTEYYLGLAVDRMGKTVQCIASASGGMEIEEIAAREPGRIVRFSLDPVSGPERDSHFARFSNAFPSPAIAEQAWDILLGMYDLLAAQDCSLVEINPCAEIPAGPAASLGDGRLVAADAKIVFDDNALFKHPRLSELRSPEEYGEDEMDALSHGLSYVGMDGNIGCIVNGAGLSMATMDLIAHFSGRPANFLDVGGSSSPEKVLNALRIVLKNPRCAAVLINIFGGITRCDDIARGILMARDTLRFTVPIVIRLIGTNEAEGRELLKGAGMDAYDDLTEAVRGVVAKAAGGRAS